MPEIRQERQFQMLKYDANDVVMFVNAAEAGTLSGAAKELGVPTSTVSRSLTRVEKSACPGTMIRHLLTPVIGKLVSEFPNLKIDLQEYAPTHVPLPRLDVDIIFMVSPPNDASLLSRHITP